MDDDVRHVAGVADAREQRNVPLTAALEDENPFLVRLDPERVEHERKRHLLGAPFDEEDGPREEELCAVAVELGKHAERLRLLQRLRLEERRPLVSPVPHDRKVLDPVDAEEHGRMRRVENLVAALPERAKHAEEVPLRMRAEVELGLLDEQDEPPQVRREQALHAHHELEPAVRLGPVMVGERRQEELRDIGSARSRRRGDERP